MKLSRGKLFRIFVTLGLVLVIFSYGIDFYKNHPSEIKAMSRGGGRQFEILKIKRIGFYNYIWESNQNLPLKLFITTSHNDNQSGTKVYSYFINPSGEGFIIIRHDEAYINGDSKSQILGPNVFIYKRNDENIFDLNIGATNPSPYPYPLLTFGRPNIQ